MLQIYDIAFKSHQWSNKVLFSCILYMEMSFLLLGAVWPGGWGLLTVWISQSEGASRDSVDSVEEDQLLSCKCVCERQWSLNKHRYVYLYIHCICMYINSAFRFQTIHPLIYGNKYTQIDKSFDKRLRLNAGHSVLLLEGPIATRK